MPFKGFICEVTGERVSPEHCLACARKGAPGCDVGSPAIIAGIARHQRPLNYAVALAQDQRQDLVLSHGFSVTELLSCARKQRLLQAEDWFDKPSKMYYAFRGTLFHGEAEEYLAGDLLSAGEQRLFWFMKFSSKTIGLSGQPDLLLFDAERGGWRLIDYKTIKEVPGRTFRYTCTATNSTIYEVPFRVRGKQVNCPWCKTKHPIEDVRVEELPPQPRGSHIEQLQLYALLIEKNAAKLAAAVNAKAGKKVVPDDAPIVAAELVYLDMSNQKRIAVDIWTREQRMELLKSRLALHIQDGLPEVLTDPAELWACDYCPVRGICAEKHGGPVGKEMLVAEAAEAAQEEAVPA